MNAIKPGTRVALENIFVSYGFFRRVGACDSVRAKSCTPIRIEDSCVARINRFPAGIREPGVRGCDDGSAGNWNTRRDGTARNHGSSELITGPFS